MRSLRGEKFEAAAAKYADNIYAVAFNYFKNPYDADDIVQEVLMALYQSNTDFESEEHLKYWLLRVAVNRCRKITVSARVRHNISFEEYAENMRKNSESDAWNIGSDTAGEQDTAVRNFEILTQVMKLPRKYRSVIHLFYYEDYDSKKIAELLGLNEGTVRTRLARGRKMLKEVLSDV